MMANTTAMIRHKEVLAAASMLQAQLVRQPAMVSRQYAKFLASSAVSPPAAPRWRRRKAIAGSPIPHGPTAPVSADCCRRTSHSDRASMLASTEPSSTRSRPGARAS
jgi:hypothetical protein